jgi:hypothetical protein
VPDSNPVAIAIFVGARLAWIRMTASTTTMIATIPPRRRSEDLLLLN